jgi:tetratricopeptide (TPR) repeat protein
MKTILTTLSCLFLLVAAAQPSENLKKGIDLLNKGEDEEAIACFEKEIKSNQNSSDAWYYLGLAKNNTDLGAGLGEFTKAVGLNPDYAEAYNSRAGIYSFQGETEKALSDYNNAVRSDPSEGGYVYNRATVYLQLKEYQKAIDDCNKSLELEFSGVPFIYSIRAEAKAKLGDYEGALADCNYMIELSEGGNSDAYLTRGDIKAEMKDYDGAVSDYLTASRSGEEGGYCLFKIGQVRQAMNDQKGACEMFERAVHEGFDVPEEFMVNCK